MNNDGIRQANSRLCATQRLVSGKHEIYVIGFAAYLDSELEVTYSGPDTHSVRTIIGGKTFARGCDPRNAISSPNTFTLCTFKSEPTSVYMGNCQPTVGIALAEVPLSKVSTNYHTYKSIIVQAVASGSVPYRFANLHIALVRDCLLAYDTETLGLACSRSPWHVAKDDLRLWFDLSKQLAVSPTRRQFTRGQNAG